LISDRHQRLTLGANQLMPNACGEEDRVAIPRFLVLETSGRVGQVALAEGEVLRSGRRLDESRHHARDLAPRVAELLAEAGWSPRDLDGVVVSRGPGSYTGLRVGIMSAKALAYATGCVLLGVETFAAIAAQAPPETTRLDVVADAQQEKVYVQRFRRPAVNAELVPESALTIRLVAEWTTELDSTILVSGPGLRRYAPNLPPTAQLAAEADWEPRPESLLRLALPRFHAGERDDMWALEPLYLRPSSAEEKWAARATPGG
jgi:tRNA threonylcarbamoyladenosine biosynthesis protein TsaB